MSSFSASSKGSRSAIRWRNSSRSRASASDIGWPRGDEPDAPRERIPLTRFGVEHRRALPREPVVAAARSDPAFPPRRLERSFGLQAVERRVEPALARLDERTTSLADALGDLIAVEFALAQDGQDEERRRALEQLGTAHEFRLPHVTM